MRLIDADALRVYFAFEIGFVVDKEDIDAAPTVRCGKCQWYHARHCDHSPHVEVGGNMTIGEAFGCAYFERRMP